jgi:hypothetical protein
MTTPRERSQLTPLIIIGLVILLLGLGGYVFFAKTRQTNKQTTPDSSAITQGIPPTGSSSLSILPTISSTNNDNENVTQNGITMTISPTHGPAGTKVKISIIGIVPNPNAPYATITLLAINGLGKDSDTTSYTFNTTKLNPNGTYATTYVIPNTVLTGKPGDQNYTTEVPIGIGNGNVTFSYQHPTLHDISIKAPFTVTSN